MFEKARGVIKSKQQSQNIEIVLLNLCRILGLNKFITKNILSEYKKHFNIGSLEAISDSLLRNGIQNKAIKVEKNKINKFPLPAILFLEKENQFVIIEGISSEYVTIVDSKKGRIRYSFDILFKNWGGIALLVSVTSALNNQPVKRKIEKTNNHYYALVFLSLMFLVYELELFNNGNILQLILLIGLNFIGLFLSFILLKIEITGIGDNIKKFCQFGKAFDCFSVARSKLAKIFNFLSLAELGFIFFTMMIFIILMASRGYEGLLSIALIIVIFSFLFVIISIAYQLAIIKKWCLFCLIIDLVICIQLLVLFPEIKSLYSISLFQIWYPVFFIIFSFILLSITKSILKRNINERSMEQSLNFLNSNFDVIESVKSQYINVSIDEDDIVLGKKDSKHVIVFLLNLECKYCKNTLKELLNIIEMFPYYGLVIRLISLNSKDINDNQLIRFLYLQNKINGSKKVLNNLSDLFFKKGYKSEFYKEFINFYKDSMEINIFIEKLERNKSWCELNNIFFTPCVIVNGKLFPSIFPSESLFYYFKVHSKSINL